MWERADVELEGDPALQQAVRFSLFHVLQAGARAERRGIPAKGLTGRGYDGHSFWDMETYTLPVLTYVAPDAAGDALRWRHSTIEFAEARARELGVRGVAFPWRTIRGQECSGYWPAGTAALHVNADIADAVRRYLAATGPDEYTALADNNVFTNLMAARNLRTAADLAVRHTQRAAELGVDQEEIAGWRDAASAMAIPYDDELQVTAQSEAFTRYRRWDFEPEQKARDFDCYERITVRDSSLSACIQAVVAAEVGHLELAYDYFGETAFIDLRDLAFNTRDGVHLAALAGSWLVAVAGSGGMRDYGDTLAFAPRLPSRLTRLTFRLVYRGRRMRVDVRPEAACYELLDGEPLELVHDGEILTVAPDSPQTRPLAPTARRPVPEQPPARHPPRRHRET